MSDDKVGFVLAGGGFKGAFELGALQHLIGTHGLVPRVITATSAGAVLGTVVGQGRDAAECRRRLVEAEGDLMAMTRTDVVFAEQPWFAQLEGTTAPESIHRLVTQHGRPSSTMTGTSSRPRRWWCSVDDGRPGRSRRRRTTSSRWRRSPGLSSEVGTRNTACRGRC